MTDEQRSETGWIGVPKWGVILGRALRVLRYLDSAWQGSG